VTDIISRLRDDTIYGNAWKYDYSGMRNGLPAVVDSAYLLIPRRVWDAVGEFDEKMDAAFEEIDYQIRAIDKGFRVDVADLPIIHLNMHTRHELKDYWKRWGETERYFLSKYPARKE
jgi:GT2 family glycosyltransferase